MSNKININNLPYNIQTSRSEQIKFLVNILDVDVSTNSDSSITLLTAICAVFLYRHLNSSQRIQAMQFIRSVSDRKLQGQLIDRVLMTTFINPKWGMWSLTNHELEKEHAFHDFIDRYASYIGIGASGLGVKDMWDNARKAGKLGRGGLIMLVIWGSVAFNKTVLTRINTEMNRRKVQITTEFH